MAKRLSGHGDALASEGKLAAPSAPPDAAVARALANAQALAVMHPSLELTILGKVCVFREYGYVEGLKLQAACRGFLDDMYQLFARGSAAPPVEEVADLFSVHVLTVQWMAAQSMTPVNDDPQAFVDECKANTAWIGTLPDLPGDALISVWWEVNRGFFTRRLQRRLQADRASKSQSASPAFTTP